jgi:hypothetical protein
MNSGATESNKALQGKGALHPSLTIPPITKFDPKETRISLPLRIPITTACPATGGRIRRCSQRLAQHFEVEQWLNPSFRRSAFLRGNVGSPGKTPDLLCLEESISERLHT